MYESTNIKDAGSNADVVASGAQLVAGTAWLFADPAFEARFDYLFVDEAGQVSLANLMAVATGARNLVLLGDHMQLGQPIQGVHPGRSGESALDYLLDGLATIPPDRGIFLPTSYRMHEDVCRFISDAVYDGRLEPDAANQRRRLVLDASAHPALRPTGIRFHPVTHEGCKQRSQAEADVLREIVASLLAQRWIDKDGSERPIALDDILVVAPYNVQVNLLREVLPPGTRVGTIDKFQGQEARGGARVDDDVERRRPAAQHRVPLRQESPQRGRVARAVPRGRGREPGAAAHPVQHAGADGARQYAVLAQGIRGGLAGVSFVIRCHRAQSPGTTTTHRRWWTPTKAWISAATHGWLLELLPERRGLILDVGAGSGRDAAGFAAMGHEVVAVEPSTSMLREASMRHADTRIRWIDDRLPGASTLRVAPASLSK